MTGYPMAGSSAPTVPELTVSKLDTRGVHLQSIRAYAGPDYKGRGAAIQDKKYLITVSYTTIGYFGVLMTE